MRRQDKEITDKNIIGEVLQRSELCRLGLTDDGEAYIVPVYFAYDGDFICIHSAPSGRKIDIIKRNNHVAFEIEFSNEIIKDEVPCKWTAKYQSVMGKGTITIENDIESKKHSLDLIMRKYGADTNLVYDRPNLSGIVILKLKIESLTCKQSGSWQVN